MDGLTRGLRKRLDRLENVVLALVGKVRTMDQRFSELQNTVTGLGGDLRARLQDLVAAHDQGNNDAFEEKAQALDEVVNQVQNLGHSGNTATKAGQSPSPAVDLQQNRGPTEQSQSAPPKAQSAPSGPGAPPRAQSPAPKGDEERDVVVKGREMPE